MKIYEIILEHNVEEIERVRVYKAMHLVSQMQKNPAIRPSWCDRIHEFTLIFIYPEDFLKLGEFTNVRSIYINLFRDRADIGWQNILHDEVDEDWDYENIKKVISSCISYELPEKRHDNWWKKNIELANHMNNQLGELKFLFYRQEFYKILVEFPNTHSLDRLKDEVGL